MMNLEIVESNLKDGQVPPHKLAIMKDWLAGYSSSLMDRQLALQLNYATYFKLNREKVKSDKALKMEWLNTESGKEESELEVIQKKIKLLREAISSHLRVADNQARNLY